MIEHARWTEYFCEKGHTSIVYDLHFFKLDACLFLVVQMASRESVLVIVKKNECAKYNLIEPLMNHISRISILVNQIEGVTILTN